MKTAPNVLIACSAPPAFEQLTTALKHEGAKVECLSSEKQIEERLSELKDDLCILFLPKAQDAGLKVLKKLRESSTEGKHLPVVVVLEEDSRDLRLQALQFSADDVWSLPVDVDLALPRIQRLLSLRSYVKELKQQSAELHQLSVTDGLTLVFNHRYFQSRFSEEFRRAQRYSDFLSLMLIDLDHFKRVNDKFGHPVGDEVLRDVAATIKANIRDTDVVARYGGEEFVVLLPKTPLAGALTVAERVWAGVGNLKTGPQESISVTLSIGVATYPSDGIQNPDALLQVADEALYSAKRSGRNRVVAHSPSLSPISNASGPL